MDLICLQCFGLWKFGNVDGLVLCYKVATFQGEFKGVEMNHEIVLESIEEH